MNASSLFTLQLLARVLELEQEVEHLAAGRAFNPEARPAFIPADLAAAALLRVYDDDDAGAARFLNRMTAPGLVDLGEVRLEALSLLVEAELRGRRCPR